MVSNKLSVSLCLVVVATHVLSGCSGSSGDRRLPKFRGPEAQHLVGPVAWHAKNERSCLASGYIRETPFIRARSSLGRPTGCGAERPFVVSAALRGGVALQPAATLRCPMIGPVEHWLYSVVQPAARRYLGRDVVGLRVMASYACRSRNSRKGAKLSEHGRANALDIGGFELSDGSKVTVKRGWQGARPERAFLRSIHRGACRYFSTVLGPNSDRYHHDHFHIDLARHGLRGNIKVCR